MGLGAILTALAVIFASLGFRRVEEGERLAVYRLGKFSHLERPGEAWVIPFVDRTVRVNLDAVVPGWRDLDSETLRDQIDNWLSENVRL